MQSIKNILNFKKKASFSLKEAFFLKFKIFFNKYTNAKNGTLNAWNYM